MANICWNHIVTKRSAEIACPHLYSGRVIAGRDMTALIAVLTSPHLTSPQVLVLTNVTAASLNMAIGAAISNVALANMVSVCSF